MLDKLIAEFYILDDESRKEILKIIEIKHEIHDDADRVMKLKHIIQKERINEYKLTKE